ncbi:MAG: hypothetical protein E7059_10895 [Treponema bryantii]|nr:hypothetical protein [Treponema bryantii]
MKKIKFFSLLLFVLISFFSCASSKVVVKDSLFDDWRYKGFGSELPSWFEPAYLKDVGNVKKALPEFTEKDVILGGNAISADHAEKLIAENKNVDGYEFIDSCWAKLAKSENLQTPYVFLIVLKKINE